MEKLKKNKEFSRIYNKGKKITGKYILIFENFSKQKKFGFVASKKVGNSVYRSRAKRLIREVVRLNESMFENNKEYILVVKSIFRDKMKELKYKDIEKDILGILKKKNEKNINISN